MAGLLADAGERVHVIAQRWSGATDVEMTAHGGRLTVHRVALDAPLDDSRADPGIDRTRAALLRSSCPVMAFAWQAAQLANILTEQHGVDVVEAPDWEAPLAGLLAGDDVDPGKRRPRYLVHLHSSTEQVYRANTWSQTVSDYEPLVRFEEATMLAADALLSPSVFVARQAAERLRVPAERVTVIPYPLAAAAPLHREASTWSRGGLCHIGRLEPRKGVLELLQAWASVAPAETSLHFAGADVPADVTGGRLVGAMLVKQLPRALRGRVHFHGTLDRAGLREVLAHCWAAVVPSRWDNLPYSCLEAMASGLPVIASPNGGMRELLVDDESGWIAEQPTATALAQALRRALATPAERRRAMGEAAARAVSGRCDASTVARRHLELKRSLATTSAVPQPHASTFAAAVATARDGLAALVSEVGASHRRPHAASAMARAVQRTALPPAEFWRLLTADERRALVSTALSHPFRMLRQLVAYQRDTGATASAGS
jgi:glycogen(starch) synthase